MSQVLTQGPALPPLALAAAIACVAGAAALANCSVLAALLRTRRTDIPAVLMQLALADLILGATLAPELWSFNAGSWSFGSQSCAAFRGINVFASTASAYLVATIALHSLATINIEEKAYAKRLKRKERDDDEEIRSSRHSLVTSDSSTPPRTMNLDYRLIDGRPCVLQPSIFVWILSVSLSVPEFVLATTVHASDRGVVMCTIVDTSQRLHMYSVLADFNAFVPLLIMSVVGPLVIIKLKIKKVLSTECFESIAALKLSLWLIVVYIVFCAPRSMVTAYNIYSKSAQVNDNTYAANESMTYLNLATSGTYIVSTLIRPLLCIILLPSVRKSFSSFGNYSSSDV